LSDLTTHTIDPIPRKLLKEELNRKRFVRNTNKLDNEIYIVDAHNSPNTMQEIGRLREVSFAEAGGGTGNPVDIDEYDTQERCYQQLIVWSPEDEEIVGGYRFMDCADIWNLDPIPLSTTHYFNFSERFIKTFMPYTIELGRSWVQPKYQPQVNARKGVFALDNLWDGLGAVVANSPHAKYFFGKVTMYTHFNQEARDAVLSFMHHYFPDADKLVWPIAPLPMYNDMTSFLASLQGLDFKEGLRVLSAYVRERDELIPPLINNYMQLSATMKMFGTAMNNDFGAVEESAILVTIKDIYPEKHERYVTPYLKERK
jgi:hypothetical protein